MKKRVLMLAALAITSVMLTSTNANADLLASDDFSYADGSLVPNGGWANHSGTPGDMLVAGGKVVVQHGTPSEDANLQFAAQSTGIIEAVFDIIVNDDTVIGGGDFEYFAHFFTQGSFNFRSRMSVVAPVGVGDYSLGISSTTSDEEAISAASFNFGDIVSVVLAFNVDSGIGSLRVGAETLVGTSAAPGEIIDAFGLRQSDSSNNETVLVDNLVISSIPEPSSIAFLGMLGIAVAARRRK